MMTIKMKKSAFIMGITSLFAWIIPIVGIMIAVIGIHTSREAYQDYDVPARVLCWFGLVMSLMNSIGFFLFMIIVQLMKYDI